MKKEQKKNAKMFTMKRGLTIVIGLAIIVAAILIIRALNAEQAATNNNEVKVCVESDAGMDPDHRGYAAIMIGDNVTEKIYDGCASLPGYEDNIFEYYCNGTQIDVKQLVCDNGCTRGACIPGNSS